MDPIVEKRRKALVEMIDQSGQTAKAIADGTKIPEPNLSQMRKPGGRPVTDKTLNRVAKYLGLDLPNATPAPQGDTVSRADYEELLGMLKAQMRLTTMALDKLDKMAAAVEALAAQGLRHTA